MLAYSHYDHTMMYITIESYISGHSCILSHVSSTYLRAHTKTIRAIASSQMHGSVQFDRWRRPGRPREAHRVGVQSFISVLAEFLPDRHTFELDH